MLHSCRAIITALAPAGFLLATALTVFAAGSATAGSPKDTGCADNGQDGGWSLTSTNDLIARGYKPTVTNNDVNADGYICTKPVSHAFQDHVCEEPGSCTVPVIYFFRDNDLTPAH